MWYVITKTKSPSAPPSQLVLWGRKVRKNRTGPVQESFITLQCKDPIGMGLSWTEQVSIISFIATGATKSFAVYSSSVEMWQVPRCCDGAVTVQLQWLWRVHAQLGKAWEPCSDDTTMLHTILLLLFLGTWEVCAYQLTVIGWWE